MFGGSEKKELSNAYSMMMETSAWKDLEEKMANERMLSLNRMDSKSSRDLTIAEVCEEIGIRKGISKVLKYAEDCRKGF